MEAGQTKFDVVAIGEILWEHRMQVARFPAHGDKAAYRVGETRLVGVAAFCLERAKKGERVALAAQIGDDARDARLKGELAAAGVDLSRLVQKTGHVSSDRWIFEEDDASEKTTLIMPPGSYPEDAIKPEWLASARELWMDRRGTPAAAKAAKLAKKAGIALHLLAS
ncbi:MAG TPA: hypothetical protein VN690_06060 [Terriglobales bacterium]|nr:hypothetical protein [Terriglobales bacterium]